MYFRGKDCSKNNSLLERVDLRVQHTWRLRVMGSFPCSRHSCLKHGSSKGFCQEPIREESKGEGWGNRGIACVRLASCPQGSTLTFDITCHYGKYA